MNNRFDSYWRCLYGLGVNFPVGDNRNTTYLMCVDLEEVKGKPFLLSEAPLYSTASVSDRDGPTR